MKDEDVQFSSGALSKYAELQVRTYADKGEDEGVGFEGFVKLYEAILADPEVCILSSPLAGPNTFLITLFFF